MLVGCWRYDASGTPLYVIWNGSKYFYTTNLQGDVVAIVSTNGNPVVYYTYDAWGNILSITGTRADNLGKYNPLRYRGYVYDQETHLYYLQSRYYDPEWGRFLNADSFVATGQGLLGNNMFAYCLNNPVMYCDPSGNLCIMTCHGDINIMMRDVTYFRCGGSNGGGGSINRRNVKQKIDFPVNTDEQAVLDADSIAFYKGRLVIKLPIGRNAASLGVIFIGDGIDNVEVVKHEYGHSLHWDEIGALSYIFEVAIPSVTINLLDRQDKLPYDYYSYPWEAEANARGGSTLSQSGKPKLPQGTSPSFWELISLFFE